MYKTGSNDFSNFNQITGLAAGTYQLVAQDANECLDTNEVIISEPPAIVVDLGEDLYIDFGQNITIVPDILNAVPPIEYHWSPILDTTECNNCPELILENVENSQLFSLLVIDSLDCEEEDFIWINVNKNENVFIATGFSPNGDGVNDFLFVQTDTNVQNVISFEIYDRWGELIFKASDTEPNLPELGWNGRFQNSNAPQSVYVWKIEVQFIDDTVKKYSGKSTLMR